MSSHSPLSPLAKQALANAKAKLRPAPASMAASPRQGRRIWTKEEEQLLRIRYPNEYAEPIAADLGFSIEQVYGKASRMGLKKSQAFMDAFLKESGARRAASGQATRFKKGQTSWNKGKKGLKPGGRAAETQFKPGTLNGRAAQLHQPLGTERVTADGIRQRKIRDDGPPQYRWKSVHSILWEEAHGAIPPGHIVVFRDGCPREPVVLESLELISRAERMRRNTIHRYPAELKTTIRLVGKLKRVIREAERHEQQTN